MDAYDKTRIIDQIDALAALNLKGKYYFSGEWFFKEIDSFNLSKLLDVVHFKGSFECIHCEFEGHELEELSGKLDFTSLTVFCQNFLIKDGAGIP